MRMMMMMMMIIAMMTGMKMVMTIITLMAIFIEGLCVEISQGSSVCEISGLFIRYCHFSLNHWINRLYHHYHNYHSFHCLHCGHYQLKYKVGVLLKMTKTCHLLHQYWGDLFYIIFYDLHDMTRYHKIIENIQQNITNVSL